MQLLGKAQNPEFWHEVRESEAFRPLHEAFLSFWKDLPKDIPTLPYSAYRLFAISGERPVYEIPYNHRRRLLSAAMIYALLYPENEEHLSYLSNLVYEICNEFSWCIPAHQLDGSVEEQRIHLDLTSTETGLALAKIDTLLGDRLDPFLRRLIRAEIDKRIINSFRRNVTFWWETLKSNWAAVCAGSVGCTFMLLHPELYPEVKCRIDKCIENYLDGLGEDGICEEGFGYWQYGYGYFTIFADMTRIFSGGKEDWFKTEKASALAPFLSRMYLSEGSVVSFSDAGREGWYGVGLLHYLKKEHPDTVNVPDSRFATFRSYNNRGGTFLEDFRWFDPTLNDAAPVEDMTFYAPKTQWLIKRTHTFGFAAKAGHNREEHNHNDVGSFILAAHGTQLLTDPGSGIYSMQYFAPPTRYTYTACGSFGHSVPYFGTDEDRAQKGEHYGYQKYGKEFAACDVSFENDVFSMDLAPAYGEEGVKSVRRTFTLEEQGVTLTDVFDTDEALPITERFVSLSPFTVTANGAATSHATLAFDTSLYEIIAKEDCIRPDAPVYFLDLRLKKGVKTASVRFTVID